MRRFAGTLLRVMTILFTTYSLPARCVEPTPGEWTSLGKSGGSLGGATIHAPARKQVLRWGGLKSGNDVRALDSTSNQWTSDYAPDKAQVGGNFYGGQACAGWITATNRPGPFFLFRQACWDSQRQRLVIVAENLTAAYDPVARIWTDLKAGFTMPDGQRKEAHAPKGYQQPWFAPVPGQWGSCAYDAVNDEIMVFPLWVTRNYEWNADGGCQPGPVLPDDAGVRAGHHGTFIFDCKTATWSRPELGSSEILAARRQLADLIDAQRLAARAAWKALLSLRQEKKDEAARLMGPAAATQKQVNDSLAIRKTEWEKLASGLKGYERSQVETALGSLASISARADKVLAGFAAAQPTDLPALCSRQQALYRELRLLRRDDLPVQPLPRCSTSVVFDPKNRVIVMAGGDHLDERLSDTWVYDCTTRRWQRKSNAPEAADWPGMCFDSKRGLVVYSANKGTYGYDAATDKWFKLATGRPGGAFCDMAYDPERDLYVLNVARDKFGSDEQTFVMPGVDPKEAAESATNSKETVDDSPFPPPSTATALERIASMPANTWIRARPPFEPTHRSWSTMSWDATLRAVIYQGGGHAGTMDNTVSAYFPECNQWVNAFRTQHTPQIFAAWSCAGGYPAYERGMGLSQHCRYYESIDGVLIHGSSAGFQWATRERPIDFRPIKAPWKFSGGFVLCPEKRQIIQFGKSAYYDSNLGRTIHVYDIDSGTGQVFKTTGPCPQLTTEWSGLAVHPDRELLVVHGAGDHKARTDNETWTLDLKAPTAWQKLETSGTTPVVGMAKLNAIPGTDLLVCAMPASNDLWVLDLARKAWKPLPVDEGEDKLGQGKKRFDLYGQCVWDPHHKIFVMVGLRGGYEARYTYLLKPDFNQIKWE